MNNIFGRIVSLRDVRNAIVQLLVKWVPTYVGAMERQAQLQPGTIPMPPDPVESYRGALDFDAWMPSWSPVYIAVVNPIGKPERASGSGPYLQQFDAQIACNYQYDGTAAPTPLGTFEEDDAVQYVDMLGMAACAALIQQGGVGVWPDGTPVSLRTRLVQYPMTSFPYPIEEGSRRVARSRFSVTVDVADVVNESAGPSTPMANPYADVPDWPIVSPTVPNVIAKPLTQQVPPEPSPAFRKPS